MSKVLIIEDDVLFRDAVSEVLADADIKVAIAATGEEAIDLLREQPDVNLILLDIFMPKMDGLSFYAYLKNILQKDIPVIILTNLPEATRPPGVKAVLIKTNTPLDQLVEKVKFYLAEADKPSAAPTPPPPEESGS